MRAAWFWLSGSLTVALLVPSLAAAVTLEVTSTADGWADNSGSGWGTLTTTSLTMIVTGLDTSSGPYLASLAVEFDISGIPAGASVDSAQLLVIGEGAGWNQGASPLDIFVHGYTGDGIVGLDDFEVSNQIAGPFRQEIVNNQLQRTDIDADVTGFVQSLIDAEALFAGFTGHVGAPLSPINFSVEFIPRERFPGCPEFSPCPKLTVTYTPEPDTALSSLLALLTLALISRSAGRQGVAASV